MENIFQSSISETRIQLPLDATSKQYLTINTHRGLFKYNRVPFSVASAPAIFQRHMEVLLQGLDGVSVYLDDILVTGRTVDEHLCRLAEVLQRLQNSVMRLNKKKCSFLRSSIEYLGHVVDKDGIHPTEEKVRAIKEAPAPTNVTQLRSFLGLLYYYNKFLPTLAATLTPLYTLLNKHQHWGWEDEHRLFNRPKKLCSLMLSSFIMIHTNHCCWHVMPPTTVSGQCCHMLLMLVKNARLHTSLVHFHQLKNTILNLRKRN